MKQWPLAAKHSELSCPTWANGKRRPNDCQAEELLERRVSSCIGDMQILWLAIGDGPGPTSDRAYMERNLIGLLTCPDDPIDPPSEGWLGGWSPRRPIRDSGLWNLDFLHHEYQPECLDVFDEYVSITLGRLPPPDHSLAPVGWRERE